MKHLKLFENHNISESKGDFYSKFWIKKLESEFGKSRVDESKKIKPLYGGGLYTQIGYNSEINDDEIVGSITIEGITNNGCMLTPSIIVFGKDGIGLAHASLHISIERNENYEKNIDKVIDAAKAYLTKFRKS